MKKMMKISNLHRASSIPSVNYMLDVHNRSSLFVDLPTCYNLLVSPKPHLWICTEWKKKFESSNAHVSSKAQTRQHSAFFSAFILKTSDFFSLFCATFLCFLLVILLFKWSLSMVLKCCLVFWRARRLRCALQRKFIHEWAIVFLALRSVLMD